MHASAFASASEKREAAIRSALEGSAEIVSCELTGGWPPAIVRFATHELALEVMQRAAAQLAAICSGVDTLYNERSYDGRICEPNEPKLVAVRIFVCISVLVARKTNLG